ncbi:hypothetical protein M438DRAFT_56960 [Aureobasidium pullulans EXF-150]|uniref:Uncharacterized protein n=1 Tax=Aureobasidium pullulans EXF-150 TaxID=1043002 RepID=A0A074X9J2_AURPU|nr:uncharacterized protein M438DRAFT_56960 [Aureobasidium pullulans EXF-150]KEQ82170.1 hypothetical protein M438DRAFT_56960 [Aureobasidium pullulans EXF-150]
MVLILFLLVHLIISSGYFLYFSCKVFLSALPSAVLPFEIVIAFCSNPFQLVQWFRA